jgi:hypothetical protein
MKTVYQFEVWDISASEYKRSPRWGTSEGIKQANGWLVGIGVVVNDDAIETDGLTATNFDRRQVRRVGMGIQTTIGLQAHPEQR